MAKKKKAARKKVVAKQSAPALTCILYGASGCGKTSFAAQFPSPYFICDSQERGITVLQHRKLVPAPARETYILNSERSGWPELLKELQNCHNYGEVETIVLESLTGIENLAFLHWMAEHYRDSESAFYHYWKGPKEVSRFVIPELVEVLNDLNVEGKNVIITAHSTEKQEQLADGTEILKNTPYCERDTWARLHRWVQACLFIQKSFTEDKTKKGLRKVARPDFERLLWVEATPYCDAKNWFGMEGCIDMGTSPKEAYSSFLNLLN